MPAPVPAPFRRTHPVKFYAPAEFPARQAEIRAYTIAAFRIAHDGAPLSTEPMGRKLLDFLIKGSALEYWKKQRWLQSVSNGTAYALTEEGVAICARAQPAADGKQTEDVAWWEQQFRANTALPRFQTFRLPRPGDKPDA